MVAAANTLVAVVIAMALALPDEVAVEADTVVDDETVERGVPLQDL